LELKADNSTEQSELLLSGLVVERNQKLTVYNRIYKEVFNLSWVSEMLIEARPYGENFQKWLSESNKAWLLQGRKLREALQWKSDKNLSKDDYQFFTISLERVVKNYRIISGATSSLLVTISVLFIWELPQKINANITPYVSEPDLFSNGERTFFLGNINLYQEKGIEYFKNGKYKEAKQEFEKAKSINRENPDPELEIYYNNAIAKEKQRYLTLAIVIPINAKRDMAIQILKGVALAQSDFNKSDTAEKKIYLNIVIADDRSNPQQAKKIARELTKDSKVVGVIGHNDSTSSLNALPIYQKADLPLISPTSSSIKLSNQQGFFRTISSDKENAAKLANNAIAQDIKKVIIYYKAGDAYSESLKEEFEKSFKNNEKNKNVQVLKTRDLGDPTGVKSSLFEDEDMNADASVLFPNTTLIPIVVDLVRRQRQLAQSRTLKLMGGDALHNSETLKQGKEAIKGLVLGVPWFAKDANAKRFADKACRKWGNQISWRTATSYDATQAFIAALSDDNISPLFKSLDKPSFLPSLSTTSLRKAVLKNLQSINLPPEKTSGDRLQFKNGERIGVKSVLVRVVKGKDNQCSDLQEGGLQFEKVEENT
ncbi:MAG: ABC transporter substrate-binding protein, partial [Scytonema sp. PMC 1069.18]|nr:ABC transporter substrate-binding protein [Scytonema sp. PMC 1069.18]